ncbi:MAG: hypothetical protein HQK53_02730 [Oligoflexia bacterium]|nr:hypothetical protein [Oligoflexia bacterium]
MIDIYMPWSFVIKSLPTKKINWPQSIPPKKLLQRSYRYINRYCQEFGTDTKKIFDKQTVFTWIKNYSMYLQHILYSKNKNSFIGYDAYRETFFLINRSGAVQDIVANRYYDDALLSAATLDCAPHEVAQFRVKTISTGQLFYSELVHGDLFSVSNIDKLVRALKKVLFGIKKIGLKEEVIELGHVHPSLELLAYCENEDIIRYIMSPNSASDLLIAKKLASLKENDEARFLLKAITPSGVNYQVFV